MRKRTFELTTLRPTRYGAKLIARRRRRNKAARKARKRNRATR